MRALVLTKKLSLIFTVFIWIYFCLQFIILVQFSGTKAQYFKIENAFPRQVEKVSDPKLDETTGLVNEKDHKLDKTDGLINKLVIKQDAYFKVVTQRIQEDAPLTLQSPGQPGLVDGCPSQVNLLRGHHKPSRGFLTIGISTVPRQQAFYLADTLASVISKMSEDDKNNCTLVVFMASFNKTWSDAILTMVDTKFKDDLDSGLIQVVQPREGVYANLGNFSRRTFNDSRSRVMWRTKQNIDYSLLFAYCETISQYYIHIEDDVTAASGFVSEVRKFIHNTDKSGKYWFVLEFSGLGFIGKLFRSSDLCTISNYLFLFQLDKPCDLLFADLKRIKVQTTNFIIKKSLFQHNGVASSLTGKVQKLIDKTFKEYVPVKGNPQRQRKASPRKNYKTMNGTAIVEVEAHNNNPKATIWSTMLEYKNNIIECGYVKMNCFFWTQNNHKGDYYSIVFDRPTLIHTISVTTGNPRTGSDKIQHGTVTIGVENECNHTHVANFEQGKVSTELDKPLVASCLKIELTENHKNWIIISSIEINKDMKR